MYPQHSIELMKINPEFHCHKTDTNFAPTAGTLIKQTLTIVSYLNFFVHLAFYTIDYNANNGNYVGYKLLFLPFSYQLVCFVKLLKILYLLTVLFLKIGFPLKYI